MIEVFSPKGKEGAFAVHLSWGRLSQTPKRQVKQFQERDRMLHFLKALIKTRLSHGYALLEKSDDVPPTLLEHHSPAYRVIGKQLQLF